MSAAVAGSVAAVPRAAYSSAIWRKIPTSMTGVKIMTDEKAKVIAEVFNENYERAMKKFAFNGQVALAAATVYTIDDLLHSDPEEPGNRLERKIEKLKEITDKWENEE